MQTRMPRAIGQARLCVCFAILRVCCWLSVSAFVVVLLCACVVCMQKKPVCTKQRFAAQGAQEVFRMLPHVMVDAKDLPTATAGRAEQCNATQRGDYGSE
jgi:hypothetical protein